MNLSRVAFTLISFCYLQISLASAEKYYDMSKLQNLKGQSLKTQLYKLLEKTHNAQSYGALYSAYFEGDVDRFYDNDGSVVDIYSENPQGKDSYNYFNRGDTCGAYSNEGDCFNREHLFPQSAFDKRAPMRTDYFHIFPTDGKVNGVRGNHPFGEVSDVEWTSKNGSKLGKNSSSGYRGYYFEPIDEFKGDVARALLYFAIRYENRIESFRHEMLDGSADKVYKAPFLKFLLKWHKEDPVSDFERRRNDNGENYQGNRNPLIDHPEFVAQIWDNL